MYQDSRQIQQSHLRTNRHHTSCVQYYTFYDDRERLQHTLTRAELGRVRFRHSGLLSRLRGPSAASLGLARVWPQKRRSHRQDKQRELLPCHSQDSTSAHQATADVDTHRVSQIEIERQNRPEMLRAGQAKAGAPRGLADEQQKTQAHRQHEYTSKTRQDATTCQDI